MDLPKDFDSRHWWILTGVAGALIAAASAPVKFVAGFAIGLALLLFGIGQWIDHPVSTRPGPTYGSYAVGYPWRPTFFGSCLTAAGGLLFLLGLWRLLVV